MTIIRPDICAKCSGQLDWYYDTMADTGKCKDCGEIWYPQEEDN